MTYSDCFSSDTTVVDVEFIIFDQPDFNIDITDSFTTYCPGDDAVIEVFPNGGVGAEMIAQGSNSDIAPYTYEWQWPYVGSTAIKIHNPLDTTTYYVQVTDVCGYIDTASVEVFVTQYDPLIANADRTYVCEDTLAQICVNAEGGEGNYTYSWSNESSTECIEVFHQLDPYTVTVTDGCDNQVLANGFVDDGIQKIRILNIYQFLIQSLVLNFIIILHLFLDILIYGVLMILLDLIITILFMFILMKVLIMLHLQ